MIHPLLALLFHQGYRASFPVTAFVNLSARVKLMIVYGAILINAGVKPRHNTIVPSDFTLFTKQSAIEVYIGVPFAFKGIICIRDFTTSNGLATIFATSDEHKVEQNIIGRPKKFDPFGPNQPLFARNAFTSDVTPN
mmetsp:Transcript_4973/g.10951  ORF Transcript_4973/g.10951 Transcript_4973/m.10951 type:complete len:137 (-) Transcript_4973:862-1272(-)